MPGVLDIGTMDPESPQRVKAESIKLWLPSQLDAEDRDMICLGNVVNTEKELRFAQLEDSLNDLRRARRTRLGLVTFHKVQLAGQGQRVQTKSQAAMQSIQDRINRYVRRYRVARDALLRLDPHGDWKELYLPLTDNDNRGPMKELEEIPASDGQYIPSWIWRSNTMTISPEEVNEDMRVEWAQCMARADRWKEELDLLQEEMRRVVLFLEWRSGNWLAKVDSRVGTIAPAVRSGLSAYAKKQGSVFHNLAVRFCQRWRSTLISLSLPYDWATKFLEMHKEPLDNPDFIKKPKPATSTHLHSKPSTRLCNKSSTGPCDKSSASATTPAHIPPLSATPEVIDSEVQVSDVDSDGISSGDDNSGYESTSSLSE